MELLVELVRQIRKDTIKTTLTLVGTALGSAAIVFLVCTLHAATVALGRDSQNASGSDVTHVQSQKTSALGKSRQNRSGLGERDVEALARREGKAPDAVIGASAVGHREGAVTLPSGRLRTMRIGIQSGSMRRTENFSVTWSKRSTSRQPASMDFAFGRKWRASGEIYFCRRRWPPRSSSDLATFLN